MGVELRAGVQLEIGEPLADQASETQVGDDQRVEAGFVRRREGLQGGLELVVLEQDVERQVHAGAVEVGPVDRRGGSSAEVGGEGAGAPALEPR